MVAINRTQSISLAQENIADQSEMQAVVAGYLQEICEELAQATTLTLRMLGRADMCGFQISAEEQESLKVLTNFQPSTLSQMLQAIGCSKELQASVDSLQLFSEQDILERVSNLEIEPVVSQLEQLRRTLNCAIGSVRTSLGSFFEEFVRNE